jgi:hypothetical protein
MIYKLCTKSVLFNQVKWLGFRNFDLGFCNFHFGYIVVLEVANPKLLSSKTNLLSPSCFTQLKRKLFVVVL